MEVIQFNFKYFEKKERPEMNEYHRKIINFKSEKLEYMHDKSSEEVC